MAAAWCAFYRLGVTIPPGVGHGSKIWAYLKPWHYYYKDNNGKITDFNFWNVEAVSTTGPCLPPPIMQTAFGHAQPQPWTLKGVTARPDSYEGYLCVNRQNMSRKHDERFFFLHPTDPNIPLDHDQVHAWTSLIENYQEQHERAIQKGKLKPDIPGIPFFSRHISTGPGQLSVGERTLKDGDLCYAKVEQVAGSWVVRGLYPVMISRKLHEKSPLDLLRKSLCPATRFEDLSPADRVFGWVNQSPEQAKAVSQISVKNRPPTAWRSLVQVGPVSCQTSKELAICNQSITLAILGQPKPQQGRFYVGNSEGRAQTDQPDTEQAGYRKENRLRGPKVYPHHAQGVQPQEAYTTQRSDQNRTIKRHVNPETKFTFDLHITNLSAFELGALVWLLSLPPKHFLRLGLGKPLGFGSVGAELLPDSRIADGAMWIEALRTGTGKPTSIDLAPFARVFQEELDRSNLRPLLQAFLTASRGFGDLPIHTPRRQGAHPSDGKQYKWFVENDNQHHRHTLPDLDGDVSLPLL